MLSTVTLLVLIAAGSRICPGMELFPFPLAFYDDFGCVGTNAAIPVASVLPPEEAPVKSDLPTGTRASRFSFRYRSGYGWELL